MRVIILICRNAAKFECRRPCCVSSQTGVESSSINNITTTTTIAAAAADDDDDDDDDNKGVCSPDIKVHHDSSYNHHQHRHRCHGIAYSQPVGPVRCRSTPGQSLILLVDL